MKLFRVGNYLTIYLSHFLKVFAFVLLLPLFTKVFSKDVWGMVVAAQAFSFWLQIIVEYGYNLSATRSIAQMGNDSSKIVGFIVSVLKSKVFLSLCVIFLAVVMFFVFKSISRLGDIAVWAVVFAIIQGFSPVWYYLSFNKLYIYSIYDIIARLAYLALCFIYVKSNNDAYLIFAFGILTGSLPLIMSLLDFRKIRRGVEPELVSMRTLMGGSFSIFIFAVITSVYTSLNILILSNYEALAIVAVYSIADRIVRTTGNLLEPLNRIFYAKMSKSYTLDTEISGKSLRVTVICLALSGMIIFTALRFFGHFIVDLVAPDYIDSVVYINVLSFYIPFLVLNNVLGLHITLPLGFDRQFNFIFILSSIISLASMLVFVPRYGPLGLAWITVATEMFISASFIIFIIKSGGISSMVRRFKYENKFSQDEGI